MFVQRGKGKVEVRTALGHFEYEKTNRNISEN